MGSTRWMRCASRRRGSAMLVAEGTRSVRGTDAEGARIPRRTPVNRALLVVLVALSVVACGRDETMAERGGQPLVVYASHNATETAAVLESVPVPDRAAISAVDRRHGRDRCQAREFRDDAGGRSLSRRESCGDLGSRGSGRIAPGFLGGRRFGRRRVAARPGGSLDCTVAPGPGGRPQYGECRFHRSRVAPGLCGAAG